MEIFERFIKAFKQLPNTLKQVQILADKQAETRREVVSVLNRLRDTLTAAGDQVSVVLSEQIVGFQIVSNQPVKKIRVFFQDASMQMRRESISERLKKGHVCHELHVLFDEYGRPSTDVSTGAQPVTEWLRMLFGRSTKMRDALFLLWEGEKYYLDFIEEFLQVAADKAERLGKQGIRRADLINEGEKLVEMLREKRSIIRSETRAVEDQVEHCIKLLVDKLY